MRARSILALASLGLSLGLLPSLLVGCSETVGGSREGSGGSIGLGGITADSGGSSSGGASGGGSSGGAGSGGSNAGGAGSGGSSTASGGSGGSVDPMFVEELGADCEQSSNDACDRTDPKQTLICNDGKWESNGTCDATQACSAIAGSCADLVPECEGKIPGDQICSGDSVVSCIFNLVDVAVVEDCDGRCVESTSSAQCVPASCGDGVAQSGEDCDDGNDDNDDDCTELCRAPLCGDGFVNNSEECDDGNEDNTDTCTTLCTAPVCGDGFLNNQEDCDDANSNDDDGCTSECVGEPTTIAAGLAHSCAIWGNGMVKCWGINNFGQLGPSGPSGSTGFDLNDITLPRSHSPVLVDGVFGATALALGDAHSCALRNDGTVTCWGHNQYSQLGNGASGGWDANPTEVQGLSGAIEIAAGANFTCVRKSDDTMACWGIGGNLQLGNGGGDSPIPVTVPDLSGVVAIGTGGSHACAVKSDGTVACWGYNGYGAIGSAGGTESGTPVTISNLSQVTALALGEYHSCALRSTGTVACWGYNATGQLGAGTDDSSTPLTVQNLSGATAISSFGRHTCALLSDSQVSCWGINGTSQLGYDAPGELSRQANAVPNLSDVIGIALGYYHSCAQKSDGTSWCWGGNAQAQLGTGSGAVSTTLAPVQVAY